jgi:hypothetical protein
VLEWAREWAVEPNLELVEKRRNQLIMHIKINVS